MKNILDLNKRAWNNIAEKYNDRSETPISDVFTLFTGKLPEKGKVLDLGCGTGLPYARSLVEKGFDIVGVDLSEDMVKVASKNVPEASFVQLSMNEIMYRGVRSLDLSSPPEILVSLTNVCTIQD